MSILTPESVITVTEKKELIKLIGDWITVHIQSVYSVGGDQILLTYENKRVIFKSENIRDVAYIAFECHAINGKLYSDISYEYEMTKK